jgi:hypothetical protein
MNATAWLQAAGVELYGYRSPGDLRAMAPRGEDRSTVCAVGRPPAERSFILNPAHRDLGKSTAASREPFSFDPRMWGTQ